MKTLIKVNIKKNVLRNTQYYEAVLDGVLYQYETDGDATVTYGVLPCGIDPANGKYATWELIENGTKLKEVFTRDIFNEIAGTVVVYNVDFINSNKLIVSRIVVELGKTYTETNTYTR